MQHRFAVRQALVVADTTRLSYLILISKIDV